MLEKLKFAEPLLLDENYTKFVFCATGQDAVHNIVYSDRTSLYTQLHKPIRVHSTAGL